mmetsp:Transcript_5613/g.15720  ORF Transcript_5613/g.15720 Transcript_5613/m.15720 type:complete len:267 (+) Transcript_5613:307-1107(+)
MVPCSRAASTGAATHICYLLLARPTSSFLLCQSCPQKTNRVIYCRGKGSAAVKLEAWITYLIAAAQPAVGTVAVFDADQWRVSPGHTANLRQSIHTGYKSGKRRGRSPTDPGKHSSKDVFDRKDRGSGKSDGRGVVRGRDQNAQAIAAVERAGAIPVTVQPGYEADDLIATLSSEAAGKHLRVLVASKDSDMQNLLGPAVAWLELMDHPTHSNPCACVLHTEESFTSLTGFPPQAYPQFLALVGKPSAGVKPLGVGKNIAQRLIAR